jgi:site-specific recombinase XerD
MALGGARLVVPKVGVVRATVDPIEPWVVEFPVGVVVPIVARFMRELMARDSSVLTCRSYAFDLLRWWRFLAAVDRPWERACRDDVREFVVWLRTTPNPQRRAGEAGGVNARTGKRTLGPGFAPATINHALSVVSAFYAFAAEQGEGPVVNPVPVSTKASMRRHRSFDEGVGELPSRAPYRQRQPDRLRRTISDSLLTELFASLGCHRDRALVAFYLSSGARASELLGLRHADIDWGNQTIVVVSKGSRAREVIPAAPDAFVWLRLYLESDRTQTSMNDPVWWTRREPRRPLTYGATRALLQRVNDGLGTNVSLHDFRHTYAFRLASDPNLSIVDVQAVLRHRRLSTTQRYVQADLDEVIKRVRDHHQRASVPVEPVPARWGFDPADLAVLFGER